MLVDRRLRVVALQPAVLALDHPRVQISGVDLPLRHPGWRVRLGNGVRPQPPAAAIDALGPLALIGGVGADLRPELLIQTPLGFLDALGPLTRDRRGLLGA